MKLRDKITLKTSQKIANWYADGLEENMPFIINAIACEDDGSDIKDIMECDEEELLDIFAQYISKKNKMMKSFQEKIKD
ncbi:MAG: hypothetical protein LCH52_03775 [Bacteroidetes bacterium]|nr:hypothetical protein [Bacteroidota bacterium]